MIIHEYIASTEHRPLFYVEYEKMRNTFYKMRWLMMIVERRLPYCRILEYWYFTVYFLYLQYTVAISFFFYYGVKSIDSGVKYV